ncbi:MAG: DUF2723 domain-containing protein [bacterium]|nr:DUF2723 domain-containing protein [bacterium]
MILSNEQNKTCLAAIFVFLISMWIYLMTLNPSIWWEDSGELTTTPYTLGITHPPGYPLYTFVTKVVMTLIPVSNIGFRGNLANAYWGGLSAVFIFLIVLRIEKKLIESQKIDPKILFGGYLPAIVAGILTSTAATIWLYSITSEEYSLNLFFMTFISWLFFVWEEKKDIRYMFCISFIYGMSFAHHQQAVIFFFPFLYFAVVTDFKTVFHWKNFTIILFLFILGWSAYAYMPIRSSQHPLLNWGTPYLWDGFKFSVKRDQYGPMSVARDMKTWVAQLNRLGFIEQFNIYIFLLSFLGLYRMIRKNSTHTVFLALATVCSGLFFVWITNLPDPGHMLHLFRKFLLPLYALCAIWITYGLCFILEAAYLFINKIKPVSQKIWAFSLIPFLLLPVSNLSEHYKTYDYHKSYFTYDFIYNMANTLEKNSVVWGFLSNDTFNWWFYNYSEGRRLDVVNIHQRMITLPWYFQQTKDNYPQAVMRHNEFLDWNLIQDLIYRSVVFTRDFMTDNPNRNYYYTFFSKDYLPKRYPIIPKGILFRDYGTEGNFPMDETVWLNYRYRGINSNSVPRCDRDNDILGFVATLHSYFGQKYMQEEKFELAIYHFQVLAQIDPKAPHIYYSLGYAYSRLNKQNFAIREFRKFLEVANPNSLEVLNVKKWLNTVQPQAM